MEGMEDNASWIALRRASEPVSFLGGGACGTVLVGWVGGQYISWEDRGATSDEEKSRLMLPRPDFADLDIANVGRGQTSRR